MKKHPYQIATRSRLPRLSTKSLRNIAYNSVLAVAMATCATASAQIAFKNVSDSRLIGAISSETWGASVGDVNNDYWPDIFVGNHRNRPSLYQYNADGTFSNNILQYDVSNAWVGNRFIDTHGAAWSDFDNDGDDDLVVGSNAGSFHVLMRSEGTHFINEAEARLGVDTSSSYSTWYDFNKDGLSDLFQGRDSGDLSVYFPQDATNNTFLTDSPRDLVGCEGDWAFYSDINDDDIADYICNREGPFPKAAFDLSDTTLSTNIASSLPTNGSVVDSIAVDLNNDLRSDLVLVRGAISASGAIQHGPNLIEISSDTGGNEVVRFSFTGGGTLGLKTWSPPNVTEEISISDSATVAGFVFAYDAANDRWSVSRTTPTTSYAYVQIDSTAPMANLSNDQISVRDQPIEPRVYLRENGAWRDATADAGLAIPLECKSVVAADFDNDMDQDLFLVCGHPVENLPNRLFENDGNGVFTEVANAGGAGGITGAFMSDGVGTGEGAVSGDFDNNGFIDLFVLNGNNSQPVRGRVGPHEMMLNEGNNNRWIELKLKGTTSDADATGARIVATAGGQAQLRELGAGYHRWSQNDNRIHFGLGSNETVDLSIRWPSGLQEQFTNVGANRLYLVTEGTGIEAVDIAAPTPMAAAVVGDECGTPAYRSDMDTAIFIYRDCATGRWSIRASAALGEDMQYTGSVTSEENMSISVAGTLEANDVADDNNATNITFNFATANADIDGFNLFSDDNSTVCLSITNPDDVRAFVGPKHRPVTLPVDLNTLQVCDPDGSSLPSLSVNDVSTAEDSGSAQFILTLSRATAAEVTVSVAGTRDTAMPGEDYIGFFSQVSFAPGETSKGVPVTILDDNLVEPTESLGIRLFNESNASVSDRTGTMTIVDNDTTGNQPPVLTPPQDRTSIVNAAVSMAIQANDTDGDSLTYSATGLPTGLAIDATTGLIAGTPSAPSSNQVTVTVRDSNGGSDSASFTWTITASISPTLSVADISVLESDGFGEFVLTLTPASQDTVSVSVATIRDTATPGQDFYGLSSTVTFAPGETRQVVSVQILDDSAIESDESLYLRLHSEENANVAQRTGVLTIVDNDPTSVTPTFLVDDVTVNESVGTAEFVLTLSEPSTLPIMVTVAATSGTAQQGQDYFGFSSQLTFAPGQTSQRIPVVIIDDDFVEPDERMRIRLFNPTGALIDDNFGDLTIVDNDSVANNNPVLTDPGSQSVQQGATVTLQLTATDADGDTLTYAASGLPTGLALNSATGMVSGTPSSVGNTTTVFTVTDGRGGSSSVNVVWTITSNNEFPIVVTPGGQSGVIGSSVSVQINAADADGDTLTYTAVNLPLGLSIDAASGVISGTLAGVGSYSPNVTVDDGRNGTASVTFSWQSVYIDNFESDNGTWITNPQSTDTATTGFWDIGNPERTSYNGSTIQPGSAANGQGALLTANRAPGGLGCCDIDNGMTSVRSTDIVLSSAAVGTLRLNWFFAYLQNSSSADYFRITVVGSNGTSSRLLDARGAGSVQSGTWTSGTFDISQFRGQTIYILFEAADESNASLVEAGVDDVVVE